MDDELGKIHIVGSVTISYGRMYMHKKCLLIILSYKHSMLMSALADSSQCTQSCRMFRFTLGGGTTTKREGRMMRVRPPMTAPYFANADACHPQLCIG